MGQMNWALQAGILYSAFEMVDLSAKIRRSAAGALLHATKEVKTRRIKDHVCQS